MAVGTMDRNLLVHRTQILSLTRTTMTTAEKIEELKTMAASERSLQQDCHERGDHIQALEHSYQATRREQWARVLMGENNEDTMRCIAIDKQRKADLQARVQAGHRAPQLKRPPFTNIVLEGEYVQVRKYYLKPTDSDLHPHVRKAYKNVFARQEHKVDKPVREGFVSLPGELKF
jgi:hypothetical protein